MRPLTLEQDVPGAAEVLDVGDIDTPPGELFATGLEVVPDEPELLIGAG